MYNTSLHKFNLFHFITVFSILQQKQEIFINLFIFLPFYVIILNVGGVVMWQFWLIAAGIFFICEIITAGFLIFWLGVGALIAMIVSFFTGNLIIQTAVFVLSSAILLLATRPFVDRFANNKTSVHTNAYSVIDQEGLVIEDINPVEGTGQVKISGEVWSAICKGNTTIKKGTTVKVLDIKGVKVLVEPLESTIYN
jgi:membrane protein implicated in regulation of membrane protease activity